MIISLNIFVHSPAAAKAAASCHPSMLKSTMIWLPRMTCQAILRDTVPTSPSMITISRLHLLIYRICSNTLSFLFHLLQNVQNVFLWLLSIATSCIYILSVSLHVKYTFYLLDHTLLWPSSTLSTMQNISEIFMCISNIFPVLSSATIKAFLCFANIAFW